MQVSKWGNSLAIRLPAVVVEALELREGDEIEVTIADARRLEIERKPSREELIQRFDRFLGRMPIDFRFDRDEANARYFFDSNVVLYVVSDDRVKRDRARKLLIEGGTVSVQVLNEIANVCRRKLRLPWDEVRAFSNLVRESTAIVPVTVEMHERGLRYAERYGLSIYDAFITAAAVESGCDRVFSEDMHSGLLIDGSLQIHNPFDG